MSYYSRNKATKKAGMTETGTSRAVDELDITNPDRWAAEGYPWDAFEVFRREAPIYWYEREGVEPFWSFAKQNEMHFISRHPRQFSSEGRRLVIGPSVERRGEEYADQGRSIITTDPPLHGIHRGLVNKLFTPHGVERLRPRIEEIVDQVIDDLIEEKTDPATGVGHCDFVLDVSARLPLYLTCELLGVPREDAPRMFELTNITLGAADPEYNKGKTPQEAAREASDEQRRFFRELLEKRREDPKDDITSIYLSSRIKGEPLKDNHVLAEMGLIMAGGFETTRNATSGGMLGLIQNPDQYDILLANPTEVMPTLVEEALRWSTPIIHFGRDCIEDIEVGGVLVRKGQTICMWYASGNRDEDVFENPDVFDIQRTPNNHVTFGGFGEHYCIGANLARMSMKTMYTKLVARIERFELDGEPQRLRSFFLGGIKHMPVSFRVRN